MPVEALSDSHVEQSIPVSWSAAAEIAMDAGFPRLISLINVSQNDVVNLTASCFIDCQLLRRLSGS